jgi:hypothetical protein
MPEKKDAFDGFALLLSAVGGILGILFYLFEVGGDFYLLPLLVCIWIGAFVGFIIRCAIIFLHAVYTKPDG